MSDSAESVVRKFLAAWLHSDLDELVSFFSDDAVYTDGPRGVHRGIDAIRAALAAMVKMVPSTAIDIKTLVASGGTVMTERVGRRDRSPGVTQRGVVGSDLPVSGAAAGAGHLGQL